MVSNLCNTYDVNTGACLTCYGGYELASGACVARNQHTSNCVSRNAAGICVQCRDRFYLTQNQCVAINPYCINVDPNTGFCSLCTQGYTPNRDSCDKK